MVRVTSNDLKKIGSAGVTPDVVISVVIFALHSPPVVVEEDNNDEEEPSTRLLRTQFYTIKTNQHAYLRTQVILQALVIHLAQAAAQCQSPGETGRRGRVFDHLAPQHAPAQFAGGLSRFCQQPRLAHARIAGIDDRHGGPIEAGRPANLALIDLDHEWTITGAAMASRSANTPYEGRTVRGRVRHTIWNGDLVVTDGEATR